jgi:redox-sensitive bicupin YhaK (pirin superfamily)
VKFALSSLMALSAVAFVLLQHAGPAQADMNVLPHPHIGLQTVTWMLSGSILHKDSLGTSQEIRPGQLNIMTAGHGISHAELPGSSPGEELHAFQLWVALHGEHRFMSPRFQHVPAVPVLELPNSIASGPSASASLIAGSCDGETSQGELFSPIFGAMVRMGAGKGALLPLDAAFEHAIMTISGSVEVEPTQAATHGAVGVGEMAYLGSGRPSLSVAATADQDAQVFVFGGAPLDEPVLLWWNFAARTQDEMKAAREAWEAADESVFGPARGWGPDERLPAPPMAP